MPLSTQLADAVVQQLALAGDGRFDGPEMQMRAAAARNAAALVGAADAADAAGRRRCSTREGWHLFLYPFAGRQVHIGLASLLAWRVAQHAAAHVLDRGQRLRLRAAQRHDGRLGRAAAAGAARRRRRERGRHGAPRRAQRLLHEVLASLNASELARRRFREIARVSGLVFQGYPGREARAAAAGVVGLFYEVFRKHDPGNLLLQQAEQEVLRAGTRNRPACGQRCADADAAAGTCRHWSGRRPSPFR